MRLLSGTLPKTSRTSPEGAGWMLLSARESALYFIFLQAMLLGRSVETEYPPTGLRERCRAPGALQFTAITSPLDSEGSTLTLLCASAVSDLAYLASAG